MTLPKEWEHKTLSELVIAQQELDDLIRRRREESAAAFRKEVEKTADELGISVKQLLNGHAKRRRKHNTDTPEPS